MEDLDWINILFTQLNAVREAAEHEYWLSTSELCALLTLKPHQINGMTEFGWRNFLCRLVANQGGLDFWQIQHAPQTLAQQPPASLTQSVSQMLIPRFEDHLTSDDVYPTQFIQLDQFFTRPDVEELIDFVLASESQFVSTAVSTGDRDYRQSKVLYSFPKFAQLIDKRVREVMPEVMKQLELQPFKVDQIESQLTMHNDGHFYKVHNDNGSPDTATRVLTYVYYFNRQPKAYSGGHLRLYDSKIVNNFFCAADTYYDVDPRHNSVVFFLSRCLHEVLPISCPSRQFVDSRFTINGWVRQAK